MEKKTRAPNVGANAVGWLIEEKELKLKKGHNSEKIELSPLILRIALGIVKTHSKFQVNIFSINRHYKMSKFLHDAADAKAIAILGFSPKTAELKMMVTSIFSFSHNVFFAKVTAGKRLNLYHTIMTFDTPSEKKTF